MSSLEGKVAIVTGAGRPRGMGQATALALARQGADVVVTGLARRRHDLDIEGFYEVGGDFSRLEERVAEIEAVGARGLAVAVDVTSKRDIEVCVEKTRQVFGGVDVLVNNAGAVVGAGPFLEIPDEAWQLQFQVQIKGVADFCKAVIPSMRERGGGCIINNASIHALKAVANNAAYVTTKTAMLGLTKALAAEFAPDNIRCNAVCPGTIVTSMNDAEVEVARATLGVDAEEARELMTKDMAMGRLGEPREVGDMIALLASDAASYVTGAVIPIDGGISVGL